MEGKFTVRLENLFALVRSGHNVTPEQYEPGYALEAEQALRHELEILLFSYTLGVSYGVLPWLAMEFRLPVRTTVINVEFEDGNGKKITDFKSIHHRNETIVGLADPFLGARFLALKPGDFGPGQLTLGVGVFLPLGETQPDPFALGAAGKRHQHVFFGTGTFRPGVNLQWFVPFTGWAMTGWADAQLALYRNKYDYLPSSMYMTGLGPQTSFGLSDWWFRLEGQAILETPAEWASDDAENSGRSDLLGGAYLGWRSNGWGVSAGVQLPVLSLSEKGEQLQFPLITNLTLSYQTDFVE